MEARRKSGDTVTYGSIVQIQSVSGRQFLTQTKNRAELDSLAMEVSMLRNGNEGSWWKIIPAEKIRAYGDAVIFGDNLHPTGYCI